jgi:repressor LexA
MSNRQAVYEFVQGYIAEHGYPPTVREIGEAVGLSSSGTVQWHLDVLRQQRLLEGSGRTLRLVKAA